MTLGKLANSFTGTRGTLAAAAALTGLMAVTPAVLADSNPQYAMLQDNDKSTAVLDTTLIAKKAAKERKALGLIIAHGHITDDPYNQIESPEEFSSGLAQALSNANIELLVYYLPIAEMPTNSMSMTFTNGYTTQGPIKPSAVEGRIGDIVQEYYRYKGLFANVSPGGIN